MKLQMYQSATLAVSLSVAAHGQVNDLDCPPRLMPMTSVTVPDTDKLITVSEIQTDTRTIIASYDTFMRDTIGAFPMDGEIEWTNNSEQRRRLRYRQSILLSEGIMPIIPPGFEEVCWEPSTRRLITVYEQVLDPGQSLTTQIFWEIMTRSEGLLADVNSDMWVDMQDQMLVMGAFGTNNPLYDLDQSGLVDGADLEILLNQWSESSDDSLDEANAGPDPDPVDPPVEVVNGSFNEADHIFKLTFNEQPSDANRGGHWIVPKAGWRLI